MKVSEKLVSNTIYLFSDWLVVGLFSFLFWVIVGKVLSTSGVGIVSTAVHFTIFISVFSMIGIDTALRKLIPEQKQKKGMAGVTPIINLCVRPVLTSVIVIVIFLLLFSGKLSIYTKTPSDAFLVSVITIFVYSMYEFFGAILFGLQNFKRFFLTDLALGLLKVGFTLAFVIFFNSYFPNNYLGPVIGFLLAYLLAAPLRIKSEFFKKSTCTFEYKKIFYYSFPALASLIAFSIIFNGQYVLLNMIQGSEATGIYTIAFMITSIIGAISTIPGSALFPIISTLSASKSSRRKEGYFLGLALRDTMFFIIPLALLLLFFSKHAVILFSSIDKLPATQYFILLVPASLLYGLGSIFYMNLYALGKPKIYRNLVLFAAIVFLVTAVPLINYFSVWGISFAYFITMLLLFLSSTFLIMKYVKLKFFGSDLLKIIFSSVVITAVLFLIQSYVYNLIILIPVAIFTIALYLLILLATKFYRKEDVEILNQLSGKISRKSPLLGNCMKNLSKFIEKRTA
jgi:O-antigen/teichoic acid export membrane protein